MAQMNRTVEANLLTIISTLEPERACSCQPATTDEHHRDAC